MIRAFSLAAAVAAALMVPSLSSAQGVKTVSSPLDFSLKSIDGKDVPLSQFKGKVIMLVNVASKCGNTKQYKALQALYEEYGKEGFVVIGVPANQFGGQEPGTNEEIKQFCESKYNVTFPMMAKVVVKGKDIDPLYKYLTSKETNGKFGGDIPWNFEKFLIGRDGVVVGRIAAGTNPDSAPVRDAIRKALGQ
jgi:glutathione peroxidase